MTALLNYIAADDEQSLDALRGAAAFSNLADEELACFRQVAQARSYKKSKILYLQEEPAVYFYVICSGWIKLFQTTLEGEEIIVDMLTSGDLAGESAIFEQGRHTSNAQVIENVRLVSIPSKILTERMGLSPSLAFAMLASMSRHHRRHYEALAQNSLQSAPQRIGSFLLRLCPQNEDKGIVIELPYDKTLIAGTLGMNIATFSRALGILRQNTAIRIHGRRVEIDSVDMLIQFVGM